LEKLIKLEEHGMFKAQRQVEGTGKLLSFAVIVLLKRYFEENGAPERIHTMIMGCHACITYIISTA
jgi:hypothetical protein